MQGMKKKKYSMCKYKHVNYIYFTKQVNARYKKGEK